MASTQQIKGRIKSVKNTKQITKAMELVAASRMRRAQESVQRTRAYSHTARELLTRLSDLLEVGQQPLYKTRPITARLHIVITSDRGLAGAYNSNILRRYVQELTKDKKEGVTSNTIAIGRKAAAFVSRLQGVNVTGVYSNLPDQPTANDVQPIVASVVELFLNQTVDAVDILYTHYNSSINQEATSQRLLPAGFHQTEVDQKIRLATFEPSAEEVLEYATLRLLEAQLMQALLESFASEHSMRMMAMKSASDNATELVDDLTLAFNNARQAAITQELAEITGGAQAMND